MLTNDFLKIYVYRDDLPNSPEYWSSESYESKKQTILQLIKEQKGFEPYGNAKIIRVICLGITESTTLDQLKGLVKPLQEYFGLGCFQIRIDRDKNQAFLLVSFVHPRTGKVLICDNFVLRKLSAFFINTLHIPYPKEDCRWNKSLLRDAYMKNNDVFLCQYQHLCNGELDAIDKPLMRKVLAYAQDMCEGKVK